MKTVEKQTTVSALYRNDGKFESALDVFFEDARRGADQNTLAQGFWRAAEVARQKDPDLVREMQSHLKERSVEGYRKAADTLYSQCEIVML